ncbi:hypothetical protein Cob_v011440 [Colletotrichum orbiculare MAFF 240422]|uniref:Uncharacterized protein n=1 Tax=Colletotrichum orbiculare (strain 104-T / ATCC 96160 / CBS 514.97 / LARS 414 / MAFF 240422) TaxID=1213857 RepID=N4ULU2_COLOR|nr:hypothetical protein Cob_v011440 [Colletotrichum orbiculare MAFF 240422]
MRSEIFVALATMAANALAARSMGYCLNEAGDGGAIGRTQFCCDSQFDFRLNEAGICNIPADMCGGISRCCGNGFFVFNTCPNTFPCENSAVNKACPMNPA